ncbi:SPW repeat protein [Bacillus sp. DX1.1]|uniref:SPW repeat protein n=2 Tax=unclassified Bacillus (in: firmicutes) TaxID=185979 RepID=UPI0025711659|nr:SPW repeat protein [Bacillus sp. DX3.1]MDM5157553.1 SPW repeat protein [Bacillus sp. DX1.1]WJE81769.1 SPW repeat protein [Bacillus sp. DX3.1]
MMKTRSALNGLIGLWFIIAPWALGFSDNDKMLWSSVIIGLIQSIVSFWGYDKFGWNSWQHWVSLLTGLWFVIFPFTYSLSSGEFWASVILGAITVLFSLWNLGSAEQSTDVE